MPDEDPANVPPPPEGQQQRAHVLDYARPVRLARDRRAITITFILSAGMVLSGWLLSGWLCLLDIVAYSLIGLGCLGLYVAVMATILAWWQRQ
jgi:hypothetical protein